MPLNPPNNGWQPSFDEPAPGEVLIAIWTGGHDVLDAAIKWVTHGSATHAAFIRANGNVIESFWPRVRERGWEPGERAKVQEFRIQGTTPANWEALEMWFDKQLRNPPPYSVRDLVRYALNLPPVHYRACFCSMWVLKGTRINLPPCLHLLNRLSYPDFGSPRDLIISPRLIPRRKWKP